MHPDLKAFATAYRHRFPDLVITSAADELRLEWQEAPGAPCFAITARMSGEGFIVFEYSEGVVRAVTDPPIASLVIAMNRERWWSGERSDPIAEPGTFGALVLERRLLASVRPQSPDRLN